MLNRDFPPHPSDATGSAFPFAANQATNAQTATLPLTTLTAYEMLFDCLRVNDPVPGSGNAVLIIGRAGGVGSIAIQHLSALTDLKVIATASRLETQAMVQELGAHHFIDHSRPLPHKSRP